jgi:hypothetical protein
MDIKQGWVCVLDSHGCGRVAGSCEHGNELSGHIKGEIFI